MIDFHSLKTPIHMPHKWRAVCHSNLVTYHSVLPLEKKVDSFHWLTKTENLLSTKYFTHGNYHYNLLFNNLLAILTIFY